MNINVTNSSWFIVVLAYGLYFVVAMAINEFMNMRGTLRT